MQRYQSTLIYGFAIFAMFFGSGNLVFPIQIGYATGSNWLLGFLGLFITGILLPFLGLFVIKIHKGSYHSFFNEAGSLAGSLIPLLTLSLLGSLAVVPRCIIVAHGGMNYLFPETSFALFSFIFCTVTFLFCLKDKLMMTILGQWMSPILLLTLSILIFIGVSKANIPTSGSNKAFVEGFFIGYQTMDLFAAFFFSSLVFVQIQKSLPFESTAKDVLRIAIKPSILGALLLALIYLGFVFLGSHYSNLLGNVEPEYMLPTIANHIMGSNAALFIAIAMLFSCLTTAIALTNIYSRYLCSSLKLKEDKFWLILLCTIAVAFLISLLNFQALAKYIAPALDLLYPGLIALTILSICFKGYKKVKISIFYLISIFMVFKMFWN